MSQERVRYDAGDQSDEICKRLVQAIDRDWRYPDFNDDIRTLMDELRRLRQINDKLVNALQRRAEKFDADWSG